MNSDTLAPVDKNHQAKCPNCGSSNSEAAVVCKCGYNFATRELNPSAVVGKRFGTRALAYVLDFILDTIVYLAADFFLAFALAIALALLGREFSQDELASQVYGFFSGLITSVFYFAMFEWLYGATPGKLLLGLRVVQTTGEPCGFGAALLRGLLRYVDALFFALPAAMSMKPPLQQRIGDKVAKTIVVGSKNPAIRKHHPGWRFLLAGAAYTAFTGVLSLLGLAISVR